MAESAGVRRRLRGAKEAEWNPPLTPERIMQTGLAFWPSKTLLSAIEIGVFTELARGPERFEALRGRLGLHPRSARDFLDTLVALGFLVRTDEHYANTAGNRSCSWIVQSRWYIGGMLEMANERLYPFWGRPDRGAPNRTAAERSQTRRRRAFSNRSTRILHGCASSSAR